MTDLRNIRPLADFQQNTKSHLRRLKSSGRPELLTINGRRALVIQDAAAYKDTVDAIRGIQRGLDCMKTGEGRPFRAALDEIRSRHKISKRRALRERKSDEE